MRYAGASKTFTTSLPFQAEDSNTLWDDEDGCDEAGMPGAKAVGPKISWNNVRFSSVGPAGLIPTALEPSSSGSFTLSPSMTTFHECVTATSPSDSASPNWDQLGGQTVTPSKRKGSVCVMVGVADADVKVVSFVVVALGSSSSTTKESVSLRLARRVIPVELR